LGIFEQAENAYHETTCTIIFIVACNSAMRMYRMYGAALDESPLLQ
jgi:hypothetical protein